MTFEDLGLSQPILHALSEKNYTTPTPIQQQAIPAVLEGNDLLGIAQTGTGKTAAFTLPSIDRLTASDRRPQKRSCRMLVLAPTRELAGQIADATQEYARFSKLRVARVFGGTSVHRNRQDLARGVDILVATPGRLVDLTDQKALDLSSVEILVLDEADQMLDLGFIHALRQIVRMLPKERQTLFFSATMPEAIRDLSKQYLNRPVQVSVTPAATTAERVEQYAFYVNQSEKQALLTVVLQDGFEAKDIDRVLVFTRTKHGADRVVRKLAQSNIPASAIHGNKSQPQREKALQLFRQGKIRVLVATDIAARGIDIPGVSHVINFEMPNVPEQYVHRIGRTARAGATGMAVSFCAADEKAYLRDIQKLTKVTLERVDLPEGFRDVVDSVEEHSRVLQTRKPKVQARPVRQNNKPKQDRPRAEAGAEGDRSAKPRRNRDENGQNRRRNDNRKPQGGQARSGSGERSGNAAGKPRRNRRPAGGGAARA